MVAIRTTRKLVAAYADREPWTTGHDENQTCRVLEEKMAWGVPVFQGLLGIEARARQNASTQPNGQKQAPDQAMIALEIMPMLYQLWLYASECFLERARDLERTGYALEGLSEFDSYIEEARCLLDNLGLEDEMLPIEELRRLVGVENPHPSQYDGPTTGIAE